MRLIMVASLVCSFAVTAPGPGSQQFNADLSSLEDRFFCHEYTSDTPDQRLDRLDQMVFGRVRSGSVDKRLTSLLLSVPNVEAQSVQPNASTPQQDAAPLKSESPQLDTTQIPQSSPAPDPSNDYYPTVTALEEQIAHKTEVLLPVQERLARLETIAFGKPSTSNDLSARVDRLKQYVSRQNGGNEDYLTTSNAVSMPSTDTGLNAEVSLMEREVFGKTYGRDSLSGRLTRLEQAVLPQQPQQTFTPLESRAQRLMAVLNSRNTGPFYGSPASTGQGVIATARNGNKPKGHPFLHKLGVALGDIGGMAARSMMYGGYGYY
ncbi:MAG: hypothetical protein JST01_00495 [Cyanobacteria bacterium SZAS TMP-1]|nr:hypothetical protein [Cyanobacteria bacterium SZAS TMP-1]